MYKYGGNILYVATVANRQALSIVSRPSPEKALATGKVQTLLLCLFIYYDNYFTSGTSDIIILSNRHVSMLSECWFNFGLVTFATNAISNVFFVTFCIYFGNTNPK